MFFCVIDLFDGFFWCGEGVEGWESGTTSQKLKFWLPFQLKGH